MYSDNRRRASHRPNTHKEWSEKSVLEFRSPNGEVYFHPADAQTQAAFFSNLKNPQTGGFKFDEGGFKAVASQAPTVSINGGSEIAVLGVEDLRSALRAGEELFTGYEADGEKVTCAMPHRPGEEGFQPVILPYTHKDGSAGKGGNLATLKAEKFAELKSGMSPEGAARLQAIADETTKSVMGNDLLPMHARLLWLCKRCREVVGVPTFCRETAKDGLLNANQAIGIKEDRSAALAILGRGQRDNRSHTSGASDHRGRRDDSRRPPLEKVDWHRAQLLSATATALTAAGYTTVSAALAAAKSGELVAKGIAHEGSIKPIAFALERASAGSAPPNFVGRGNAAPGAIPGDSRPVKPTGGKKRKREFVAPSRRSDGEGAGLASLRD